MNVRGTNDEAGKDPPEHAREGSPPVSGERAPGSSDEDTTLLWRAGDGDREAFHKLIDRHAASLLRTAVGLVGNHADAEDLVQEVVVAALIGSSAFRGRSSVKTWLTRILLNRVSRFRRRQRLRRAFSLDAWLPGTVSRPVSTSRGRVVPRRPSAGNTSGGSGVSRKSGGPGAAGDSGGASAGRSVGGISGGDAALRRPDSVGASDARLDVMAALASLSIEHRDVLVLREFQELSYQEIAELLGVPKGTVESRIFRARQALREALKDYSPDAAATPPESPKTPNVRGEEENERP